MAEGSKVVNTLESEPVINEWQVGNYPSTPRGSIKLKKRGAGPQLYHFLEQSSWS